MLRLESRHSPPEAAPGRALISALPLAGRTAEEYLIREGLPLLGARITAWT
jgi:hypothetical protein